MVIISYIYVRYVYLDLFRWRRSKVHGTFVGGGAQAKKV
jgi:hypothetical protein